ncbi:MAG TPA: hypothetical protein VFR67_24845 [Pilimelia sp.]|nr:hypothetical protein [Pilimelia sp.]
MSADDWIHVSQLVSDDAVASRSLLGGDPALGFAAGAPVLLLECSEAMMINEPASGGVHELQTELLIRRGFHRFLPGTAVPPPLAGWAVTPAPDGLELLDDAGNPWAYADPNPDPRWLAAVEAGRQVLVLYGAWLGVRAPQAVRSAQYGPRRRAAELRAGRAHGLVAAATVAWRPPAPIRLARSHRPAPPTART